MANEFFNPGIRLLVSRMMRGLDKWAMDNMSAPYWRLYCNFNSGASLKLGGRRYELPPGVITLIPPDTPCASALKNPVDHFYIHFLSEIQMSGGGKEIYQAKADSRQSAAVREAVELVDIDNGVQRKMRLSLLCNYLISSALCAVPVDHFENGFSDPRVDRAIEYMRNHLNSKIENSGLAKLAGMNTNAFIRLFRNVLGVTPQAHFIRMRIEHACLMLIYTGQTIDEIAEQVGFCDRYHFSRAFSRHRKTGPASFRKQMTADFQTKAHT